MFPLVSQASNIINNVIDVTFRAVGNSLTNNLSSVSNTALTLFDPRLRHCYENEAPLDETAISTYVIPSKSSSFYDYVYMGIFAEYSLTALYLTLRYFSSKRREQNSHDSTAVNMPTETAFVIITPEINELYRLISPEHQILLGAKYFAPGLLPQDNAVNRLTRRILKLFDLISIKQDDDSFYTLSKLFTEHPDYMLTYNSAFTQLISMGAFSEKTAWKNITHRLYEKYLAVEKISQFTLKDEFGGYGTHAVDWEDKHAANYVFLSPTTANGPVMILSQHTLQGIRTPDSYEPVWNNFYLYDASGTALQLAHYPPEILFYKYFPLFIAPFKTATAALRLTKLMSCIMPQHEDMQKLFVSASREISVQTKLINSESENILKSIFSPFLTHSPDRETYSLTAKHCNDILEVFNLSDESDTVKAKKLLILSLIFTKFSSSAIFGTDSDSPLMVRFYAYALMEKSHDLDPIIFEHENQNKFSDWRNSQLGLNDAYSCSAIVVFEMVRHLRKYHPKVFSDGMPPAWC